MDSDEATVTAVRSAIGCPSAAGRMEYGTAANSRYGTIVTRRTPASSSETGRAGRGTPRPRSRCNPRRLAVPVRQRHGGARSSTHPGRRAGARRRGALPRPSHPSAPTELTARKEQEDAHAVLNGIEDEDRLAEHIGTPSYLVHAERRAAEDLCELRAPLAQLDGALLQPLRRLVPSPRRRGTQRRRHALADARSTPSVTRSALRRRIASATRLATDGCPCRSRIKERLQA